ncbi:MAG TPA: TonB-dependent receptor [Puia sp.]|jgi:iron complex outermembrane receptor protein|nr:TonB-dependent receptor [Puia sp.]
MRKLLVLSGLMLCSTLIFAQSIITGKITDIKTGAPISGVSVKIKSSNKGTTTDNQGSFKIQANANDVLEISAVGFKTQSVKVGAQSDISVSLEESLTDLGEVVVTGNRGLPRVRTESPVPVDIVKLNSLEQTTSAPNLESQLNMAVPSFNYNKQSGADGSDAIDFASLRGLGYDQTLVLVNGKRRHLSAFVNEFGTRGRGNSGTDLNAIPEAAIDRVEILRDGASAQYGSDAIAGVINIILKKDVNKLYAVIGVSGYYDPTYNTLNNVDPSQYYTGSKIDGQTMKIDLNYGLPIGKNGGFINIGANFLTIGKTFRALPDTNWSTNPGSKKVAPYIAEYRRAFGDGSIISGGAMYNAEIPLAGTKTTFYSFGGYNYKHSNVYAWTRNFYDHPEKCPTDANGNLLFVPSIMRVFDPTPGSLDTAHVYYNPQEDVYIKDVSFAAGIRGTVGNNWDWDLSNVIGYNNFHYYGNKTFNATLPENVVATQNRFDDGGFDFLQNTSNLDVSRRFNSIAHGLTFSFGLEFRYENYQIFHGEEASYASYPPMQKYYPITGNTRDVASGSQGFPGFRPTDVVNASRTNVGGYLEGSLDVTEKWLVDGALRLENYSDFGFVNTYKFATRYKLTDNFNLRGSVSTGFRAPSLQQINFSNINTNIVAGSLQYIWLAPNTSAVARAAGIPPLKQETSVNYSLGFTWKPINNFTVTVDGYLIKLKNRIIFSGQFSAADSVLAPFIPATPPLNSVQFFANAVNTTNEGVDIVLEYSRRWGKKGIKLLFAGNIQTITIDKINIPAPLNGTYFDRQTFFSTREQAFLIASAPHTKFSMNLEYDINQFAVGTHLTYYGKLSTQGYGYSTQAGAQPGQAGGAGVSDAGLGYDPYVELDNGTGTVPENFVFNPKMTTDLYLSYKINKNISWIIGVDNIFNVHPDISATAGAKNASWGDSESGGPFDAVQMGYNGMRLWTNLVLHF